jgi:excisionase family DNA binding protein
MSNEELLTIRDVVKELDVNEKTVRRWIQSGELVAIRDIVGRYRISRTDLEDFRQRRMKKFSGNDDNTE